MSGVWKRDGPGCERFFLFDRPQVGRVEPIVLVRWFEVKDEEMLCWYCKRGMFPVSFFFFCCSSSSLSPILFSLATITFRAVLNRESFPTLLGGGFGDGGGEVLLSVTLLCTAVEYPVP